MTGILAIGSPHASETNYNSNFNYFHSIPHTSLHHKKKEIIFRPLRRVTCKVEIIQSASEKTKLWISWVDRTLETSSAGWIKTNLVGFVKAGLAVVVDQKAAADAAGRILALRKENFIQAARTWNEMLLVAFLQHTKSRCSNHKRLNGLDDFIFVAFLQHLKVAVLKARIAPKLSMKISPPAWTSNRIAIWKKGLVINN